MRRFLFRAAFLIGVPFVLAAAGFGADVVVLSYSGPISAVSSEYISRGIGEAEARHAAAVVIELDTPGGLDSSMRQIIQREMNARVPVIVYVAPQGARAASAGCIIVLAAEVAAMAPGTNLGAAHPITLSGGTVSEKILNDAVAYARAIAAARHRNVDWAEKAVRESASLPAEEALRDGVVDLIAADLDDLLRNVKIPGPATSLAGSTIVPLAMSWRERTLGALAEPNVAYLLFLLGVLAVIAEFLAPHGYVTGTVGVVAVVLSFIGLADLPVQWGGAALLILGIVLLVMELKITSHGLLSLAGLIAFVLGSMLVFPPIPGYRISAWTIGSVTLVWAGMIGAVLRKVLEARRSPVLVGIHRLIGAQGVAKTELSPRGVVLVGGEDWDAIASVAPIARGAAVRVVSVQGLTLSVEKIPGG